MTFAATEKGKKMKAQEYFDKYFSELPKSNEEAQVVANKMLVDFTQEAKDLMDKRKIQFDSGAVGVIRELNEKWNSVASKVEKKYGFKILKRNVIWNIYLPALSPEFSRKPD